MAPNTKRKDRTDPIHAPPDPVYLDADGDLRLRAAGDTEDEAPEFVVCSKTLARSSRAWKKMLFGEFKETKPTEGEWIVSLPDDEPEALLVALNIIHGRFTMVPKKLHLEELYWILSITHKYDMTHIVQPWAGNWMKMVEEGQGKDEGCNEAMLTFVAWELGNEELFAKMVDQLTIECSINGEGRLSTSRVCLEDYDHLGPLNLIGRISLFRSDLIQSLLDLVHDLAKHLLDEYRCSTQNIDDIKKLECDSLILGSLRKAMVKTRGALLPELATDIHESVSDLASSVQQIIDQICCFPNHAKCNPIENLKSLVEKTVSCREVILTFNDKRYMSKQRQKTGLDEPVSARNDEKE